MLSSVLEFFFVFLFFVITHNLSAYLYNEFCASLSLFGIINSIFMIPTPQCRALLTIINYTSDSYVAGFYAVSTLVFRHLCSSFYTFKLFEKQKQKEE